MTNRASRPEAPAGYVVAPQPLTTAPEMRGYVCPSSVGRALAKGGRGWRFSPDTGCIERTCSGCKEEWPADTEFFHLNPRGTGGLFHNCKACYAKYRSGRHRPGPQTRAAQRGRESTHV